MWRHKLQTNQLSLLSDTRRVTYQEEIFLVNLEYDVSWKSSGKQDKLDQEM